MPMLLTLQTTPGRILNRMPPATAAPPLLSPPARIQNSSRNVAAAGEPNHRGAQADDIDRCVRRRSSEEAEGEEEGATPWWSTVHQPSQRAPPPPAFFDRILQCMAHDIVLPPAVPSAASKPNMWIPSAAKSTADTPPPPPKSETPRRHPDSFGKPHQRQQKARPSAVHARPRSQGCAKQRASRKVPRAASPTRTPPPPQHPPYAPQAAASSCVADAGEEVATAAAADSVGKFQSDERSQRRRPVRRSSILSPPETAANRRGFVSSRPLANHLPTSLNERVDFVLGVGGGSGGEVGGGGDGGVLGDILARVYQSSLPQPPPAAAMGAADAAPDRGDQIRGVVTNPDSAAAAVLGDHILRDAPNGAPRRSDKMSAASVATRRRRLMADPTTAPTITAMTTQKIQRRGEGLQPRRSFLDDNEGDDEDAFCGADVVDWTPPPMKRTKCQRPGAPARRAHSYHNQAAAWAQQLLASQFTNGDAGDDDEDDEDEDDDGMAGADITGADKGPSLWGDHYSWSWPNYRDPSSRGGEDAAAGGWWLEAADEGPAMDSHHQDDVADPFGLLGEDAVDASALDDWVNPTRGRPGAMSSTSPLTQRAASAFDPFDQAANVLRLRRRYGGDRPTGASADPAHYRGGASPPCPSSSQEVSAESIDATHTMLGPPSSSRHPGSAEAVWMDASIDVVTGAELLEQGLIEFEHEALHHAGYSDCELFKPTAPRGARPAVVLDAISSPARDTMSADLMANNSRRRQISGRPTRRPHDADGAEEEGRWPRTPSTSAMRGKKRTKPSVAEEEQNAPPSSSSLARPPSLIVSSGVRKINSMSAARSDPNNTHHPQRTERRIKMPEQKEDEERAFRPTPPPLDAKGITTVLCVPQNGGLHPHHPPRRDDSAAANFVVGPPASDTAKEENLAERGKKTRSDESERIGGSDKRRLLVLIFDGSCFAELRASAPIKHALANHFFGEEPPAPTGPSPARSSLGPRS